MSKQSIYDHLTTSWVIPKPLQPDLSHYFILHWSPTYLFSEWRTGPIIREGITYLRIYHKCHENEIRNAKVALLSFRRVATMHYGYVLITPARTLSMNKLQPKDYASMHTPS